MSQHSLKSLLQNWQTNGPAGHVARTLSGRGGRSLTELASLTGYSKSTISTVLTELRRAGIVIEADSAKRSREASAGRPETIVSLNPDAGTAVGVLVGLEHMQAVVVDASHGVVAEATEHLTPDYGPRKAGRHAKAMIEDLFRTHSLDPSGLLGVGLAVAAPINPRDGRVLKAGGVPTWAGEKIGTLFAPVFGNALFADNESNCSAIAQMMWGVARDLDDFVLATLDLGVGGAIVYGGRVMTGFAGSAGEFGHMVMDPHGPKCRCGNRGCLERYVSDPLLALTHSRRRPRLLRDLVRDAVAGDEAVAEVLRECARAAGRGLALVGTIINPPVFVIGGELALAGDLVLAPLREAFDAYTLVKATEVGQAARTRFIPAQFVEHEGALGAAGLVLRHHGKLL